MGLIDRSILRKLAHAGMILCAVTVYNLWPHEPRVDWLAGIVFGVAAVGLMRGDK